MKFLANALWKTLQKWQSRAGLGDSPRTILTELADRLERVLCQPPAIMPASNFRVRGNIDVKGKDLTPATCRASLSGSTSVPAPPSYPPKAEWDFPHQMRATLRITTAIHLDTQSVLPNTGDMQNILPVPGDMSLQLWRTSVWRIELTG